MSETEGEDQGLVPGKRRPLPFQRRVVTLAPGSRRAYDASEWRDTLVIVARGEIELETLSGRITRFRTGDVLWLIGLPLQALRNPCGVPAVIIAVARTRPSPE